MLRQQQPVKFANRDVIWESSSDGMPPRAMIAPQMFRPVAVRPVLDQNNNCAFFRVCIGLLVPSYIGTLLTLILESCWESDRHRPEVTPDTIPTAEVSIAIDREEGGNIETGDGDDQQLVEALESGDQGNDYDNDGKTGVTGKGSDCRNNFKEGINVASGLVFNRNYETLEIISGPDLGKVDNLRPKSKGKGKGKGKVGDLGSRDKSIPRDLEGTSVRTTKESNRRRWRCLARSGVSNGNQSSLDAISIALVTHGKYSLDGALELDRDLIGIRDLKKTRVGQDGIGALAQLSTARESLANWTQ
ncbi:hypothetical protein QYF36_005328 [Acer negundo]|nr:hypothetical protein QYF36_005328 [Acer negundo]